MKKTGERQVAETLDGIREDHRNRYLWACQEIGKCSTLLDAGCGVGYGSNILSEVADRIFACDISGDAIQYAQEYWKASNIDFFVADLHCHPWSKLPELDVVVAFEVVEHLAFPELFLSGIATRLKAGGKLFISVPNESVINHSVSLNPFHFRHYTNEDAANLLTECGFQVESIRSQNDLEILPHDSGNFLLYEAVLQNAPNSDFDDVFSSVDRYRYISDELHKRSDSVAELSKQLRAKNTKIEAYKEEIKNLRKETSCNEKERVRAEKERSRFIDTLGTLTNSLELLEKDISELTRELKNAQEKANFYEQKWANNARLYEDINLELKTIRADRNALYEEVQNSKSHINDLVAEKEILIDSKKSLQVDNKRFLSELESLLNNKKRLESERDLHGRRARKSEKNLQLKQQEISRYLCVISQIAGSKTPLRKKIQLKEKKYYLNTLTRLSRFFTERKQASLIVNSGFFEKDWYLQQYQDIAASAKYSSKPELHFVRHGWKEKRDPGPLFSTLHYLNANKDVAEANINPLVHYLVCGIKEKRVLA